MLALVGAVVSWACAGASPTLAHEASSVHTAVAGSELSPGVPTSSPAAQGSGARAPLSRSPMPADTGSPSPAWTPVSLEPVLTAELHRLRGEAQEQVLRRELPRERSTLAYAPVMRLDTLSEGPLPTAPSSGQSSEGSPTETRSVRQQSEPPAALGRFIPIEGEESLAHFHRALARLAAGTDEDGKVRILAYGASHTQSDLYTGYLRAYLQSRFGDGGQGFVLPGRLNRWYRTLDTGVWHKGMSAYHARRTTDVHEEPLGLFGAALEGRTGGAVAEVITAKRSQNTVFEVHYFRQPKGGSFALSVDDEVVARVQTQGETPGPGYYSFRTTPGRHVVRAQLRGDGPVRLFGIIAETATPGVVLDTLGINGSRMADCLRWSEAVWVESVRHRQPDLVTFAYGTNEAMGGLGSVTVYERDLRAVLTRFRRAAPAASCVLIAPFDFFKREHGRWATPSALLQAIEVQRRVSGELGCGFWSGYAFMGGQGSMARWARAEPPLAAGDHVHLTRLGYVYAGIAIGDALMRAYDQQPGVATSLARH